MKWHTNTVDSVQVTCILKAVPQSECHSIANETCICSSTSLHAAVTSCVLEACTVPESLSTPSPLPKP